MASVEESADLAIPLVEFAPLLSPDEATRAQTATQILSAFTDSGFLYLAGVPVPSIERIRQVFAASAQFFERPQAGKDALAWTSPRANRGYTGTGREKVSTSMTVEEVAVERAVPDIKETFEVGRPDEPDYPNRYPPSDGPGRAFRALMDSFFLECKEVHRLLMSAIALGLGLDEHHFDSFVRQGDNTLRLLHYPPVSAQLFRANSNQVRCGAHSDYGSITLLFQDSRGGLQVQGDDGSWRNVRPIEGTIVVNAGDLLARWTNDRIRSTKHRVVEPPSPAVNGMHPARYSVAYFCNPDYDRTISAIPGTYSTEKEIKYPSINSCDYLVQRLTATH